MLDINEDWPRPEYLHRAALEVVLDIHAAEAAEYRRRISELKGDIEYKDSTISEKERVCQKLSKEKQSIIEDVAHLHKLISQLEKKRLALSQRIERAKSAIEELLQGGKVTRADLTVLIDAVGAEKPGAEEGQDD